MARIVKAIPEKQGNRKYPWDEWLDGRAWELKQGEDFDISTDNMRSSIHVRCRARGLNASTRIVGDLLYVQRID